MRVTNPSKRRHRQRKLSCEAHHRCTPARLRSSEPRHVDGRPEAAVSVRRCAVEGGTVVTCVDDQKIVGADAAEADAEFMWAVKTAA